MSNDNWTLILATQLKVAKRNHMVLAVLNNFSELLLFRKLHENH